MNGNNDGSVTYTVKELIAMLEKTLTDQMGAILTKIDELNRKLDAKASEVRVENLEKRVSDAERRIIGLELSGAGKEAVSKFQRYLFGTVGVGVLGAIVTLIYILINLHP